MPYRLRNGLHWCECAGRIVFLDLLEDRYSCLPPGSTAAFVRLARGQAGSEDLQRLNPLAVRGMLVEGQTDISFEQPTSIPLASGDFWQEPCPGPGLAGLAHAVTEQLRWALLIRTTPLAKIVSGLQKRPAGRDPASTSGIAQIISAFAAVSVFLPSQDRCLARALAFHSLCRRRGIRPSLVFGVRMNPFRAHCWVQLGGTVLIGEFEQVRLFTPIAAFG